jgi:O-antigen ligase
VLLAVLVLAGVLFWRPALEPFMLVKATAIGLGTVVVLGMGIARALITRRLMVPRALLGGLMAAFVVALLLATQASPTPMNALVGRYARYCGLAAYLAYTLIFFTAVRVFAGQAVRSLVATLQGTAGAVTAYGLMQLAGWDPFNWVNGGLAQTFSTFGNIDFAAGYVGALLPLMLWAALCRSLDIRWRALTGFLGALAVVYLIGLDVSSGLLAAIGGSFLILAAWVAERRHHLAAVSPRVRMSTLAVGSLILVALTAVFGAGVLNSLQAQLVQGASEREYLYQAAFAIFTQHPVTGGGLDGFANHFTAVRPGAHALLTGMAGSDAVHSVPLQLLADGGLLLGLTYLALMIFVAVRLAQGLRASSGDQRMYLAAVGGAWLGYHLQAAVSIDVPPLALLNWVLGGAVVALAGREDIREVALPGAGDVPRQGVRSSAWEVVPASAKAALAVVVIAVLVGCWAVTRPLRADLAAKGAAPLGKSGQLEAAVGQFDKAIRLAPWEAQYPFDRSKAFIALNRGDDALASAAKAARLDPGNGQLAYYAAQIAEKLPGHERDAHYWYAEAVRRDPLDPQVLLPAATYEVGHGGAAQALVWAERSVRLRADAESLLMLGGAQEAIGDKVAAGETYRRVLVLGSGNGPATAALKRLAQPVK